MRSAGFILCVAFCMLGQPLVHAQNVTACGQQLSASSIYRDVPARSNGDLDQWSDNDCGTDIPTPCTIGVDDSTNTCSYGDRYQCVEYVRRFYSLRQDAAQRVDTSGWTGLNAVNFIAVDSRGNVSSPLSGFTAFANNGATFPLADDIIVFKGGGFGHVAIVSSVTSSNVNIIEQNWNTQGLYSLTISPSTNTIDNRIGGDSTVFTVVGWLRSTTNIQNNPIPTVSTLSPASLPAGSTPQALTINGTNFLTTSTATYNGVAHAPTYISVTQLTISLTTADLATEGSYPVVVTNPSPGGGASDAVNFTVVANNPVPAITTLSPASLVVGSTPQTLTINGTGFLPSSSATFDGIAHAPTYLSATQLTISLTTADLTTAGSFPVVVTNPAPGGGASAAVNFAVVANNPVPAITTLSPASLAVGATPQKLTINGTGFLATSTVTFNGIAHAVTYVSASQLAISLTSADLATAGTYPVVVTNPAPGGGVSSAVNFTVTGSSSGNGQWTWMTGSSIGGVSGVYGQIGVPSASNTPGARSGAVSWTDVNGNVWLFGGAGVGSGGSSGSLNDLWEFNPTADTWTWVNGTSNTNQAGVYGSRGTPATTNIPGARSSAISWIDGSGNLWLFGGGGTDSTGNGGDLNDLWKFSPTAKTWTWVSGSNSANQAGVYGTLDTPSISNTPGARDTSVSWIDTSGNLWLFGGNGLDSDGLNGYLNDLWEFNPAADTWTWISGANTANEVGIYGTQGVPAAANVPGGRLGANSWIDASGNLWLFGGYSVVDQSTGNYGMFNDLWEFSASAKTWTWVGGYNGFNDPTSYAGQGSSSNFPGARYDSATWVDSSGNFWLFGGYLDEEVGGGYFNDLWQFTPSNQSWALISGSVLSGQEGFYGTEGTPSGANIPGARTNAIGGFDTKGNLWLFGGNGFDSAGNVLNLNDLWRYQNLSSAPSNPTPIISMLSPNSLPIGFSSYVIDIVGAGFLPISTVTFDGVVHTATYIDGNQIEITLSTADVSTAGNFPVIVANPSPGGGQSAPVNFSVVANNPVPSITTLSPASLAVGATPQTLAINGTGFLATSTVTFNGIAHTPTYVSATQLAISLTTVDLATSGSYPVVVTNPAPGGGVSLSASFSVTNGQGTGEWTWMGGSNTTGQPGVYGTQGAPSSTNVPSARGDAVPWIDGNGNFWLFGGDGLSDLWEFNPASSEWSWVGGTDQGGQPAVYGTEGIPNSVNSPGGRIDATGWADSKGGLWLFGGEAPNGNSGQNDLWEYDIESSTWTWVGGSDALEQNGIYGTQGVANTINTPGGRYNAVSWTDSNGNFWLFGGLGNDSNGCFDGLNDLWEFNPIRKLWTWVDGSDVCIQPGVYGTKGVAAATNVPESRYYAVSSVDKLGNFWLFGGISDDGSGEEIKNDLWEFSPSTNLWTWVSGSETGNQSGIYNTQGIAAAANVPGGRSSAASWIDSKGNFWLFGGQGFDSEGNNGDLNDLWEFNTVTGQWAWMSGNSTIEYVSRAGAYGEPGVYGTLGVPAAGNIPGARGLSSTWIDNAGNLWIFGGYGFDGLGENGTLNDLWRYQPNNVVAPNGAKTK